MSLPVGVINGKVKKESLISTEANRCLTTILTFPVRQIRGHNQAPLESSPECSASFSVPSPDTADGHRSMGAEKMEVVPRTGHCGRT